VFELGRRESRPAARTTSPSRGPGGGTPHASAGEEYRRCGRSPRGEVTTMAQEDTSAGVTGHRHAAEHAGVERRHAGDHARVPQRHLAAQEELYARHDRDHTLLAVRHAAEREKAADVTLTPKAALSALWRTARRDGYSARYTACVAGGAARGRAAAYGPAPRRGNARPGAPARLGGPPACVAEASCAGAFSSLPTTGRAGHPAPGFADSCRPVRTPGRCRAG
jgi:hypothetical protein